MNAIERRVLELMADGEHDTFGEDELRRLAERDVAADALVSTAGTVTSTSAAVTRTGRRALLGRRSEPHHQAGRER
jgi:hypothetical protein